MGSLLQCEEWRRGNKRSSILVFRISFSHSGRKSLSLKLQVAKVSKKVTDHGDPKVDRIIVPKADPPPADRMLRMDRIIDSIS